MPRLLGHPHDGPGRRVPPVPMHQLRGGCDRHSSAPPGVERWAAHLDIRARASSDRGALPVLFGGNGEQGYADRLRRDLQGVRSRVARQSGNKFSSRQGRRPHRPLDPGDRDAPLRAVRGPDRPHLGRELPVLRSCHPRSDAGCPVPHGGPGRARQLGTWETRRPTLRCPRRPDRGQPLAPA